MEKIKTANTGAEATFTQRYGIFTISWRHNFISLYSFYHKLCLLGGCSILPKYFRKDLTLWNIHKKMCVKWLFAICVKKFLTVVHYLLYFSVFFMFKIRGQLTFLYEIIAIMLINLQLTNSGFNECCSKKRDDRLCTVWGAKLDLG